MGAALADSNMIKSQLIAKIANKLSHIPEKDAADALNYIIELMSETLGSGGRIEIRGFGSFSLHYRPPRNAHNPKTGEKVVTTAKYSPYFKPGKELRERVNESRHIPLKEDTEVDEEEDFGSSSKSAF